MPDSQRSGSVASSTIDRDAASFTNAAPTTTSHLRLSSAHPLKLAHSVRPSKSYSTLADDIRALRETQEHRQGSAIKPVGAGLRRDNKPSPLQQSSEPSPFPHAKSSLTSPLSASLREKPKSPRERLEALLASEDTVSLIGATTNGPFSRVASPPLISSTSSDSAQFTASKHMVRQTPAQGLSRTVPSLKNKPSTGSVSSAYSNEEPIMPSARVEIRSLAVRNSSLDSTVSTYSTASQSTHSTLPLDLKSETKSGMTSPTPQSFASLVAAAGSTEGAVQALLKEKNSAQAHNAQLWRLVEKQRSMILGLNQDLERALKDKERYKRKVKDLTAQLRPTKPSAASRTDSALDRKHTPNKSPSPAPTEELLIDAIEFPKVPVSSVTEAPAVKSPVISTVISVSQDDAHRLGSAPSSGSAKAFGSNVTSVQASPVQSISSMSDGVRFGVVSSAQPQSSLPSPASAGLAAAMSASHGTIAGFTPLSPPSDLLSPMTPPQGRPGLPAVSIIEATPIPDAGSFPSPPPRSSMAHRKNVPKPLNLGLASPPPDVVVSNAEDLEDRHVESFGSPDPEARGRRRTRQADDRAREVQARQEEKERSASKQSSNGISRSNDKPVQPEEQPPIVEQLIAPPSFAKVGLPASPRLPKKLFGLLSPSGSEASAASSANPQRGSFMTPPLMSPGLPTSPRPVDRPVNAAAPRFPKAAIATPPLSPRLALGSFVSQALRRSPPSETKSVDESGFQSLNDQMAAFPQPLFSRSTGSRPGTSNGEGQPTYKIISSPLGSPRADATFVPAILEPIRDEAIESAPSGNVDDQGQIYKGFISDQYPNLLLPPNALPLIDVRVFSSRMQPSRASILLMKPIDSEDPIFVLGIYGRSDGKQLWRLEKTIQSLPALHNSVRAQCSHFDGKLPDRSLFTGHAPAKIDARRAALNAYFDLLLDTPLGEKAAIAVCDFFSRDVIGPDAGNGNLLGFGISGEKSGDGVSPDQSPMVAQEEFAQSQASHGHVDNKSSVSLALSEQSSRSKLGKARREGYLTKRGKNFGGWKARYFVLDGAGAELKYYDSPGGPQIGVIKLASAQIGKQQSQSSQLTADSASEYSGHGPTATTEVDENQYRHAFLILEPRRKDSSSHLRHVLCAESDAERDAWVAALLQYVESGASDIGEGQQRRRGNQTSSSGRIFEGSSRRDASMDSGRGRPAGNSGPGGTRKATSSTSRSRDRHATSTSRERSTGRSTTDAHGQVPGQGYHVQPLPIVPSSSIHAKNSPSLSHHGQSSQSQGPPTGSVRHQPSPKSNKKTVSASPHRGLQAISYNDTVAAEAPVMLTDTLTNSLGSPTMGAFPFNSTGNHVGNAHLGTSQNSLDRMTISGPTNATLISDTAIWGNRTTPAKEKKRSIFAGFRQRSSDEMDKDGRSQVLAALDKKQSGQVIFGIPLNEAVELSQPADVDAYLPAVVYRCLEYLRFMGAKDEEGIFRLSGSSTTIKRLREQFNTERDVKLLEGDVYDMHAVASLLKLYLRELPVSILTRELHLDFLKVMEQRDHSQKIATLQTLVQRLPRANRELLQSLCLFLLEVVNNADKNKMNVRNVGIVFAPTLNIPSPLISQLLADYAAIFTQAPNEKTSAEIDRTLLAPAPQQSASDSIRSPRHQMFSDLPTPMYNQQTFPTAVTGFQPLAFNTMSNQRHTFQPSAEMGLPKPFYAQSAAKRGSNNSLQISEGPASLNSSTMSQYPPSISITNGRSDSPSNSSMVSNSTDQHLAPLQPPITNFSGQTGKKGRRESSMVGLGLGTLQSQRKPSYQALRDVTTMSARVPEHMFQSNTVATQEVDESPIERPMARDLW